MVGSHAESLRIFHEWPRLQIKCDLFAQINTTIHNQDNNAQDCMKVTITSCILTCVVNDGPQHVVWHPRALAPQDEVLPRGAETGAHVLTVWGHVTRQAHNLTETIRVRDAHAAST